MGVNMLPPAGDTKASEQQVGLEKLHHSVGPAAAMQAGTKGIFNPLQWDSKAVSPVCMTCPVCCPRQQGLHGCQYAPTSW